MVLADAFTVKGLSSVLFVSSLTFCSFPCNSLSVEVSCVINPTLYFLLSLSLCISLSYLELSLGSHIPDLRPLAVSVEEYLARMGTILGNIPTPCRGNVEILRQAEACVLCRNKKQGWRHEDINTLSLAIVTLYSTQAKCSTKWFWLHIFLALCVVWNWRGSVSTWDVLQKAFTVFAFLEATRKKVNFLKSESSGEYQSYDTWKCHAESASSTNSTRTNHMEKTGSRGPVGLSWRYLLTGINDLYSTWFVES